MAQKKLAVIDSATTWTAKQTFKAPSSGVSPVVTQAVSGQTAPIHDVQDASGNSIGQWNNQGTLIIGSDVAGVGSGFLKLKRITSNGAVAPEIHFHALNGRASDKVAWGLGIDVAAAIPSRDFVIFKAEEAGGVTDFIYCSHRGTLQPVVGIGLTPPFQGFRLSVSPSDTEAAMGGIGIRANANTGKAFALIDSADGVTEKFAIDNAGVMSATTTRAAAGTFPRRVATFTDAAGGTQMGFTYESDGAFAFRYLTGGVKIWQYSGGRFQTSVMPDFSGTGAQLPHIGAATPSGGQSGEIRVGNGKIWANDAGTWKSVAIA